MPILKKAQSKPKKREEKIPMFHEGDIVTFDVDGTEFEGKIKEVNTDDENATVEDDNGDEYVCEFKELTLKQIEEKKGKKAEKSNKKADSFAERFNKTKAASGGGGLPEGKWEAETVEAGLNQTDKGLSGFIKYEITEAEHEGRQGVNFYQIENADGEEMPGLSYMKGDLQTLGVLEEDTVISSRAEFEEILEQVGDQELIINVREKGGYTNIFIAEMR
jgi:hypothetical protein